MSEETYGVGSSRSGGTIAAPVLPYQPARPRNLNTPIALIGCGGISQVHLQAYRNAGFNVVALCSRDAARAEARRKEFYPEAAVMTDFHEVLKRPDIEVVDITTHADVRPPLIEAALKAGKHVLSQKPYVVDLTVGRKLADLAEERGLMLAVNQNGRWAPHFAYMREVIRAGLIGEVGTVDFEVHWDHHWVLGTEFDKVDNLVLYDFAIHWFDIVTLFFGERQARRVYAAAQRSRFQRAQPPFLAHAAIEFDHGQATIALNASCLFGQEDRTTVIGGLGTVRSIGPNLLEQKVTLYTPEGTASPELTGKWFPDGFQGAMAELLCAIEEGREPSNSARQNLRSLELCFAAAQSAEEGRVVELDSDSGERSA
ncbi:MAG: Gfo/Idh/MocA family oxidoreductase [Verrucomicrobiaceae bacterium]|nr:MAG: Gfo/Idh/MocA family oxidoreductase [Verrucomicrobiaceae bacterium]